MKYKRSPYNKTSDVSKTIINMFTEYPHLIRVSVMAKVFNRSVANVRFLKGVANVNKKCL
jgi:hypothetical protein